MKFIDPVEVYFADGPMRGKFVVVKTWPFRAAVPHEVEYSVMDKFKPYVSTEWEEVVYSKFITLNDHVDNSVLRVAYLGQPPRIKDLLMRD